jgi:hypothetical protein
VDYSYSPPLPPQTTSSIDTDLGAPSCWYDGDAGTTAAATGWRHQHQLHGARPNTLGPAGSRAAPSCVTGRPRSGCEGTPGSSLGPPVRIHTTADSQRQEVTTGVSWECGRGAPRRTRNTSNSDVQAARRLRLRRHSLLLHRPRRW